MIVYLARAIQAFVMYCVNGTSRSSLLIESTDSMISLVGFINITVCTNFETHGAPYFQGFSNCTAYPVAEFLFLF